MSCKYGGNLNRMLDMIMYECKKSKDFFKMVSINFINLKSHSNYTIPIKLIIYNRNSSYSCSVELAVHCLKYRRCNSLWRSDNLVVYLSDIFAIT